MSLKIQQRPKLHPPQRWKLPQAKKRKRFTPISVVEANSNYFFLNAPHNIPLKFPHFIYFVEPIPFLSSSFLAIFILPETNILLLNDSSNRNPLLPYLVNGKPIPFLSSIFISLFHIIIITEETYLFGRNMSKQKLHEKLIAIVTRHNIFACC